jgi:hypothetical protein
MGWQGKIVPKSNVEQGRCRGYSLQKGARPRNGPNCAIMRIRCLHEENFKKCGHTSVQDP